MQFADSSGGSKSRRGAVSHDRNGRHVARVVSLLTAPELNQLAAILVNDMSRHPCWASRHPDWPHTWKLSDLSDARDEFRTAGDGGYAVLSILEAEGLLAIGDWHEPSAKVIIDMLKKPYTQEYTQRVDSFLSRVHPLPEEVISMLTTGDIAGSILAGCCANNDIVTLGRVACVCKSWAARVEPLWQHLVMSRWPQSAITKLVDFKWARKYRMLRQSALTPAQAKQARQLRATGRLQSEFEFVLTLTDPSDGSLLSILRGSYECSQSRFLLGDDEHAPSTLEFEADESPSSALPAQFVELRDNEVGWGARGLVCANLIALRTTHDNGRSLEEAMALAEFQIDLGKYRDGERMYEMDDAESDVSLFYGGNRGGESGLPIVLSGLGLPQGSAAAVRFLVEFWAARAGPQAPEPGSGLAAPPPASTCRIDRLRLMMFSDANESMEEALATPHDSARNGYLPDGLCCTKLLAALDTGDWA